MAFKDSLNELGSLNADDFQRIGTAPILIRGILILVVCMLVAGLGVHFMITPKFDKLKLVEMEENQLRVKFDQEQAKAANLSAYKLQLEEMRSAYTVMVRQLPNKTDIESLLVDLSQTSVAAGLDVEFFKPESELPREFYAEYPISISVTGKYHQFGEFVSGLAALPRIVTLSGIDISAISEGRNSNGSNGDVSLGNVGKRLKMDLVATTYRYLEED